MTALPEHPTERDRERFKAAVSPMMWSRFERDPATGEYTDHETANLFRMWWAVERERQLLQNLNQSQGASCRSWGLGRRRLNRSLKPSVSGWIGH